MKAIRRVLPPLLVAVVGLALAACTSIPRGMSAVEGFELQRYLGTWYEIARLDHSFERGLSDVSAQYSAHPDGGVKVVNRGYDAEDGEWSEAEGRAKFLEDPSVASLKVSFFGPFYGGYHVVALDRERYEWAMVVGQNRDYLWILAREKKLPQNVLDQLVAAAERAGFATDELIWVSHERQDPALD